jgi:GTP-binding protein Era
LSNSAHKSGFVSIIGKPNVGKSTLMNKLVGENLSIITAKAQTTRHRIMGILNADDFQIVYSDTPGLLEPKYELQKAMMSYVKVSLEDADVVLLVVDWTDLWDEQQFSIISKIKTPILVIINKSDLAKTSEEKIQKLEYWKKIFPISDCLTVSAKNGTNINAVLPAIVKMLPEHPGFFPKDEMTTRSERFFASEIIREKIFIHYEQEIPYSSEVAIESFKEEENIIRIRAIIFIERDSQKGILIGKAGASLKWVGTEARKDMEKFFGKKIFLETFVKVAVNWRKEKNKLKQFGYLE